MVTGLWWAGMSTWPFFGRIDMVVGRMGLCFEGPLLGGERGCAV